MAGRKNHHIPQFLQRNFGTRKGNSTQVWVFSKDKTPFKTSTSNYGAERDFYIVNGDTKTDEVITELEQDLDGAIRRIIREGIALGDEVQLSTMLAHFELRTKYIRTELSAASQIFLELIAQELENNPSMILDKNKQAKAEAMQDALTKFPLFLSPLERSMVSSFTEEIYDSAAQEVLPVIQQTMRELSTMFALPARDTIKDGLLSALSENPNNAQRRSVYSQLTYRTVHFDTPELILPDCLVTFIQSDGTVAPFLRKPSDLKEALIPLSSNVLLHGFTGVPMNRSPSTIRKLLSGSSFQSFIAPHNNETSNKLIKHIGKHATLIPTPELKQIIQDVLST